MNQNQTPEIPPAQARLVAPEEPTLANLKRQLIALAISVVGALALSVPALSQSCQAKETANDAVETADGAAAAGQAGVQVAQTAKLTSDIAYDRTKDKVDDAGDTIKQLRADLNVLLEERAQRLAKTKGGEKAEEVPPKDAPASLGKPLPPTPDAAAAAAGVPVKAIPIKAVP